MAILAATMVNLWSEDDVEIKDFVPIWDSEERKKRKRQSVDDMKRMMQAIAKTTGAKLTTKADREE